MKQGLSRYGALLLCLVLAAGLLWHIHDTRQRFQQMEDSSWALSRENARLEKELSLAETGGLLQKHWVYYKGIDPETRNVQLSVSVLPRQYDPDTQVSVVCNGEERPMEWEQGYYRLSLEASLDGSCRITAVTVAQGDQVEQAEVCWELMDYQCFTPVFSGFPLADWVEEDTLSGELRCYFPAEDMYRFHRDLGNTIGTLIKIVDGEETEHTPITWEEDGGFWGFERTFTGPAPWGSVVEYVVSMTDRNGITYRYTLVRYDGTAESKDFYRIRYVDVSTQVYAPDGTLLYTVFGNGAMPQTE